MLPSAFLRLEPHVPRRPDLPDIHQNSIYAHGPMCLGGVTRSEAYDGSDPSEKGAVSYFLGLTITKLVADHLLSIPWLMHLDVYRQDLQPVLQPGDTRPDLVGQTTAGDWVAIESKGRSNGRDVKALERAKEQVEALFKVLSCAPVSQSQSAATVVIHGSSPYVALAADSHFRSPFSNTSAKVAAEQDDLCAFGIFR